MKDYSVCQKLKKVSSVAKSRNVSARYIYKLISEGKLTMVKIDGIQFVDLDSESKEKPQ